VDVKNRMEEMVLNHERDEVDEPSWGAIVSEIGGVTRVTSILLEMLVLGLKRW
jgi:hypothetical protein